MAELPSANASTGPSITIPQAYYVEALARGKTYVQGGSVDKLVVARELTIGTVSGPLTLWDRNDVPCVLSADVVNKHGGVLTVEFRAFQSAGCGDFWVKL